MSLLALLDEGPRYGLQLKQAFEARTGQVWPMNVGQVYTTLARLERDGLVTASGDDNQRTYRITDHGRDRLARWFAEPDRDTTPSRDEVVLKLILAAARGADQLRAVIRSERKAAMETMQTYTRLKRDPTDAGDLGWLLLLDSLIIKAEGRIRWLDTAESRLASHPHTPRTASDAAPPPMRTTPAAPDTGLAATSDALPSHDASDPSGATDSRSVS